MSHKHKTVKLVGRALEIARRIQAVHQEAHAKRQALEEEYHRNAQAIGQEAQNQFNDLWPELMVAAGLSPAEVGQWTVDASYLDEHGLAFLSKCDDEEDAHTLADMGDMLQSMSAMKH